MTEINNSFTTDCMEGKLGLMKQKIIQHKNNQAAAWGTKGMENRTKKKETNDILQKVIWCSQNERASKDLKL